jgi:16S rRNA (guanine966-N2)-methyltransferase
MRIISGKFRGKRLLRPDEKTTRPTTDRVREALFNILTTTEEFTFHDAVVLDAFAGSGALGLEALSRGASHVTFFEKDRQVFSVLLENCKACKLPSTSYTALLQDAITPSRSKTAMDLVLLDPPYSQNLEYATIESLAKQGWINEKTLIVLERLSNSPSLPNTYTLITERTYGSCKIAFFTVNQLGQ